MSNFVENELNITGPRIDRDAFLEASSGPDIEGNPIPVSFTALLPMPADVPDPTRWCDDNWGVKSEVLEWMGLERKSRRDVASFLTNGSPPLTLFETVSDRFPTLTFRLEYWDETGGYTGDATIRQGTMRHVEREL